MFKVFFLLIFSPLFDRSISPSQLSISDSKMWEWVDAFFPRTITKFYCIIFIKIIFYTWILLITFTPINFIKIKTK